MVPIGPNQFAFEVDPMTRVQYSVAGSSVTGFELVRSDGTRVVAARTP